MFDANFKAWLLEINENPSLCLSMDNYLSSNLVSKEISEIDIYVKTIAVSEAIKLVYKFFNNKNISKLHHYKQIFSSDNNNLIKKASEIFEYLSGYSYILSMSKFSKLSKILLKISPNMSKVELDLLYTNIVGKNSTKSMDLDIFLDSLEQIQNKSNCATNLYSNFASFIDFIHVQLNLKK